MKNERLRIIIIDDNVNIHKDVIKVLTLNKQSEVFEELDTAIFGQENAAEKKADNYLPEFEFDTASQGREGVEKIKVAVEKGRPYALAFVDIRMPPGWDGVETIQRIWAIDPDIQIIICTAFSDYSWEETIQKLGMSDNFLILKKPFDYIAIRQLACALTQKWLLMKETKRHTEHLQETVKEKTQTLQQSLSLLRATLESTTDGVFVVDLEKNVIDYNQLFIKIWEISKTLLKHKDERLLQEHIINKIIDPSEYKDVLKTVYANIDETTKQSVKLKNGKVLDCFSYPHRLNGVIVGRVWSFRDVTERTFLEKKLEHQATHDALTDLPNRVLLYDRIQQAIANAKRHNKGFSVFFLDLDRFKLINDSLGHEIGDSLLLEVANRLTKLIRGDDTFSRVGGDEFVILFPGIAKEGEIITLAHKIESAFQRPFTVAKNEINITSSIGISIYPLNGKTPSKLLKNADLAMYKAKESQGNQFHFYTEKLNKWSQQRLKQEIELQYAINNNEFFLLFQPQFDIENKELLAVEALIRWQHPKKGIILPMSFIPLAEETGQIVLIGEWVIRETCRQIAAWKAQGLPYIRTAVNVAMQQLKQANFAEMIATILKEHNVSPQFLELEITENVIITHPEVMRMLNQLKHIGIKIVLDDFGTGNSSLNYLKKIHIDRLKIDKAFVSNISHSRSDEVIIEAIIAMGRSFGFKVLAEGVETQRQIKFLKNNHCDEVQGYYYSHPISSADVLNYLKTNPQSD